MDVSCMSAKFSTGESRRCLERQDPDKQKHRDGYSRPH